MIGQGLGAMAALVWLTLRIGAAGLAKGYLLHARRKLRGIRKRLGLA